MFSSFVGYSPPVILKQNLAEILNFLSPFDTLSILAELQQRLGYLLELCRLKLHAVRSE